MAHCVSVVIRFGRVLRHSTLIKCKRVCKYYFSCDKLNERCTGSLYNDSENICNSLSYVTNAFRFGAIFCVFSPSHVFGAVPLAIKWFAGCTDNYCDWWIWVEALWPYDGTLKLLQWLQPKSRRRREVISIIINLSLRAVSYII